MPTSPGPTSPAFTEDLSRFPSESLHSFSFAHQSEEFLHNRQNVLKRSLEFMKDRMGWHVSSNAAIASAQARVTGDLETQNMLDLLARAQLVGAGNLPNPESSFVPGPLTGPADVSGNNVFDKLFIPRSSSPEPLISPATHVPPSFGQGFTSEPGQIDDEKPTSQQPGVSKGQADSTESSRTPTEESGTTAKTTPPVSRPPSLRRTFTDVGSAAIQQKLVDTMAQPFQASQGPFPDALLSPNLALQPGVASSHNFPPNLNSTAIHGHSPRWVPAAQAIFTTESKPPWTIIAANDLACLVFGVTKAEVRKMGILEVVQEERRAWLESKLLQLEKDDGSEKTPSKVVSPAPATTGSAFLGGRGGITAHLLSKPNSRAQRPKLPSRRSQTVHIGDPTPSKLRARSRSRGVLLCGDVVPIQKRNGATGSASLWVKEKRVGLIWVLEEIHEHVAYLRLDDDGLVTKATGDISYIWGDEEVRPGTDVGELVTRVPRQGIDPRFGPVDYAQIAKRKFFTCPNKAKVNIPTTISQTRGEAELRVASFPHIAGIIVVSPETLKIKSSNSAFSGALFGYEKPEGLSITSIVPGFDKMLNILTDHDGVELEDGIVVPEHSFRKASALLALQDGRTDATATFLNPDALPGRHRDGNTLKIDVQMRVVNSEKHSSRSSNDSDDEDESAEGTEAVVESEIVYALWITYSRHLHSANIDASVESLSQSGKETPLRQPSPGQPSAPTPQEVVSDSSDSSDAEAAKTEPQRSTASVLTKQIKSVAVSAAAKLTGASKPPDKTSPAPPPKAVEPPHKKTIDDFVILEDMGQGAYGQVKLARYKNNVGRKVVLKYVTKRRILVDTWTRDRRLGTVPLEIHVLDYLRRDGLKHPNIVEMEDFFEDETNYYIEMAPHGLPGMDLFDYIELRTNMEEDECRSIFVQVAKAIHHLHVTAKVVHRDIKDENVILDGEGHIKLIDFGSAAYIKSGPFDVFVGTVGINPPPPLPLPNHCM